MQPGESPFQWLPAEALVSCDGKIRFETPIPGVDPVQYPGLYAGLQYVVERALPALERVLTDLADRVADQQIPSREAYVSIRTRKVEVLDTRGRSLDRSWFRFLFRRPAGSLSVTPVMTYIPPSVGPLVNLRGRRLQLIVKASRIHLRPGERYAGGKWHIEGSQNERIVATIIYYAEQTNVTASSLDFCRPIDEDSLCRVPGGPDEDEEGGSEALEFCNHVLGIVVEATFPPEDCGRVATTAGRILVFPNTYAHCLAPFDLVDPEKSGSRTIIVFFVVNPLRPVPSTGIIPPQDTESQRSGLSHLLLRVARGNVDVANVITEYIVNGITRQQQLRRRKALMAERSAANGGRLYGAPETVTFRTYSMCEH